MSLEALLCIDLQYLCAADGHGVHGPDRDVPPAERDYFFPRLEEIVLPHVARLQAAFREAEREVLHCRIRSLTRDGRDRSAGHKRYGLHAPPDSMEAEFLPAVAPHEDEIVIDKSACGVFTSTNLAYVLRNLGVSRLAMCGVLTNECVESAAREACDLGFEVFVVEDACAAKLPALHQASLRTLATSYAQVVGHAAVLASLRSPAPDLDPR